MQRQRRSRTRPTEISYSDYQSAAGSGQHQEGDDHRREGRHGDFKHKIPTPPPRRTFVHFSTRLPVPNSEAEVDAAERAKASRSKRRTPKSRCTARIINFVPLLPARRLLPVPVPPDAGGRREGVLVRQVARRSCSRATRRRSRSPTSPARTKRSRSCRRSSSSCGIRRSSRKLGGRLPKGVSARRTSGHRQDAAGESCRR